MPHYRITIKLENKLVQEYIIEDLRIQIDFVYQCRLPQISAISYWPIDLIISHQLHKKVRKEYFLVWTLRRVKDDQFIAIVTDGNKNQVSRQRIPFSDFPYDVATLWLVGGCLMLPREY